MNPRKTDLPASTLSEMLVVMILTGIILLSVFDGFTLFQRFLLRVQGRFEETIERIDQFYRLESLFAGSDSIRGDESRLELYRQGQTRDVIVLEDSLLIVSRPAGQAEPDTVWRNLSHPALIRNPDYTERIDSLLFDSDSLRLRFGIRVSLESRAETEAARTEQTYSAHENQ